MRRQFGDRKISRRTDGPEGDFVGPQTVFAWDLDSTRILPEVPYPYEVKGKLVTGYGSFLPSLTVAWLNTYIHRPFKVNQELSL